MKLVVLLTSIHVLLALFSIGRAWRSGLYRPSRIAVQALLAVVLPIVGPAWVLWMIGESDPETPKPTTNEWHRLEHGEGD